MATWVRVFDWGYYLFDAEADAPSIPLRVALISIVWQSAFSEYETLIADAVVNFEENSNKHLKSSL